MLYVSLFYTRMGSENKSLSFLADLVVHPTGDFRDEYCRPGVFRMSEGSGRGWFEGLEWKSISVVLESWDLLGAREYCGLIERTRIQVGRMLWLSNLQNSNVGMLHSTGHSSRTPEMTLDSQARNHDLELYLFAIRPTYRRSVVCSIPGQNLNKYSICKGKCKY